MFASHILENQHHSPSPTMVMHAMVTSTSSVEEKLANLTRAIEGLTKYVQDQHDHIVKITYRMEGMMDEE